jgi:hypothetical protein
MVGKQELSSGKCLLTFRKPSGSHSEESNYSIHSIPLEALVGHWRMVSHEGDMPSSNSLGRSSRFLDLLLYVIAVYINHKHIPLFQTL